MKKWKANEPSFNFDIKEFLYYSFIKNIKYIPLLYHLDYRRPEAEKTYQSSPRGYSNFHCV